MSSNESPTSRSWLASDRPIPRLVARPVRDFLDTEISGGVLLLIATTVALVWANSPFGDSYDALWHTEVTLTVGSFELAEDLQHWVNDALMAIFFFVVGLEVKREISFGELSDPRKAAFPSVAALGGMIVPALLYVAFNAGSEGSAGWGIPMATDIAFALGVLALFGSRAHPALKVFLLSLAVADDIGAILVIALFYSTGIEWGALLVAAGLIGLMLALRRLHVVWMPIYVVVGTGVWLATFESGVHATIAGVVLGLLTPSSPLADPEDVEEEQDAYDGDERFSGHWFRWWRTRSYELVSPCERLEHALHPWSSFLIIPIFALANAGVRLGGDDIVAAASSRVTIGIVAGLVVGKIVGISSFAYIAQRTGFAEIPRGVRWPELIGVAALGGIGFTVSLFITGLAFEDAGLTEEAKVGILAASLLAAAVGALLLRASASNSPQIEEARADYSQEEAELTGDA